MPVLCKHSSQLPDGSLECAIGLESGKPEIEFCVACKDRVFEIKKYVDLGVPAKKRVSEHKRRWSVVAWTWAMAEKALSLAASVASGWLAEDGEDAKTFSLRVLSCYGKPGESPPCPARAFDQRQSFHYCNDCGCGASRIARISDVGSKPDLPILGPRIKLRFRKLQCPRKMRGFSNADKTNEA